MSVQNGSKLIDKSQVLQLFKNKTVTLEQASKTVGMSIAEFLEHLKDKEIDVVDYPVEEIEKDLENILK